MFIVVGSSIPNGKDILGNTGRSAKVYCVHVGNYEKAKEGLYHRVYMMTMENSHILKLKKILCVKRDKHIG